MSITLDSAVREAREQLEAAGVDNPSLDTRLLVAHVLGIDRAEIMSQGGRVLSADEVGGIRALVGRRSRREPVARILGAREFWGLTFGLNEATLDPRPDSETLIEVALKDMRGRGTVAILDIGAGTGCLLLALLNELPQAMGLGLDCTQGAVDRARENAEALGLSGRAVFRMSNWLDNLQDEHYDLIVSNPPYIPSRDIPALMPEVRNYDPLIALDGGEDGLTAFRLLVPQMKERLRPGGVAVFEVGEGQAAAVADLFRANGFTDVSTHMDFGGIERCVRAGG